MPFLPAAKQETLDFEMSFLSPYRLREELRGDPRPMPFEASQGPQLDDA